MYRDKLEATQLKMFTETFIQERGINSGSTLLDNLCHCLQSVFSFLVERRIHSSEANMNFLIYISTNPIYKVRSSRRYLFL